METTEDLLSFAEMIRRDPGCVAFAIMDKGPDGKGEEKMAGTIALIFTSEANLKTELGWVVTFPEYQRSESLSRESSNRFNGAN